MERRRISGNSVLMGALLALCLAFNANAMAGLVSMVSLDRTHIGELKQVAVKGEGLLGQLEDRYYPFLKDSGKEWVDTVIWSPGWEALEAFLKNQGLSLSDPVMKNLAKDLEGKRGEKVRVLSHPLRVAFRQKLQAIPLDATLAAASLKKTHDYDDPDPALIASMLHAKRVLELGLAKMGPGQVFIIQAFR